MSRVLKIGFVFFVAWFLNACKVSMPAGIYRGATINYVKSDDNKTEPNPDIKEYFNLLTRPEPNTQLFSIPYKVGIKNLLGEQKSEKGIKAWINNTLGENPVIFDDLILEKNVVVLSQALKNKGYFNGNVTGEIVQKGKYVNANYAIKLHQRYKLDSVKVTHLDGHFNEDFFTAASKIELGTYFDLDEIKAARNLIDAQMRQLGYYNFKPDFVGVLADTSQNFGHVKLKIEPKENLTNLDKKQYQINDIYVNIDSKTSVVEDSVENDYFRGVILDDPNVKFKEKVFENTIAFRPGTYFNNQMQQITNNRLLSLGTFRSVKSTFDVVNRLDSTLLDLHYFLQTQKRKSFKAELNGITRSSGLGGSQISLIWQNLNTFHGAEMFRIATNANSEFQLGGKKDDLTYRNNYRIGAEASLVIPRFFAPFIKVNPEISKVLPRTTFKVGYESFIKTGLYNLNSASASVNYSWNFGKGIEHTFRPISLSIVKSTNLSLAFIDEIFSDPRLLSILDNQFILGGGYEIVINPKNYGASNFGYRGAIDVAGNALSLFDKIRNNPDKKGKIFSDYYSQYLRLENDVRYKYQLSKNLVSANRAFIGVGVPYGNSLQLPFASQFFVGGNNSLRAFRARGIGPGTYLHTNSLANSFLGNNTGDIKLEFNTELRYKINNLLNTALFLDAGNIWMYKDGYIYGDDALFSKDFYKQFAIGTGIGFRFDFSFIVFRIDVATPLRNPSYVDDPWVIKEFKFFNKTWRKDNVIWNFAIGLPF